MIRMREHMVCPLSGNTYPLDLDMSEPGNYAAAATEDADDDQPLQVCEDYGVEDTPRAVEQQKTKAEIFIASELLDVSFTEHRLQFMEEEHEKALLAAQKSSDKTQEVDDDTAMPDELPQPQTQREKALQATQKRIDGEAKEEEEEGEEPNKTEATGKLDDLHIRQDSFHLVLKELFKGQQGKSQLFNAIIINAERLWLIVHSSSLINKKQFRYQTVYHMLAILSCMCTGYRCANKVVVPRDDWIRTHIPLTREMQKISGIRPPIKVTCFTQTKKMFQSCIANVALAQKDNIQWKE